MLLHEALHLVFNTFSRQVLLQGRLTAYLADCAVFDTFDDRRTICLTIDQRYGIRLYACLSHSPYKQQFDAIVAEVQQLHPSIDPQQVEYVFQSIRFAWGKIKSVRPPKAPVLFTPPKKKRPAKPTVIHHTHRRQKGAGNGLSSPKTRQKRMASSPIPSIPHQTAQQQGGTGSRQTQKRNARVFLYLLALFFLFCSGILYNTHQGDMGSFCIFAAGICIYVIYKYLR